MALSALGSAAFDHVGAIPQVVANVEVGRVTARRVITLVKNGKVFGDWSDEEFIGHSVGVERLALVTEFAISCRHSGVRPFPALVHRRFTRHEVVEDFGQRHSVRTPIPDRNISHDVTVKTPAFMVGLTPTSGVCLSAAETEHHPILSGMS